MLIEIGLAVVSGVIFFFYRLLTRQKYKKESIRNPVSSKIGNKIEVEEDIIPPLTDAKHEIAKYRCINCNKYLSGAPLKVTETGDTICSRCPVKTFFRNKILENLLRDVVFPCTFEEFGCKEMYLFNAVVQHEAICKFKHFLCFIQGNCKWKGFVEDVMTHILNKHRKNVSENGELVIDLKVEVKENVVVFQKGDVVTILYYHYSVGEMKFGYCISYISCYSDNISCNIRLSNFHDKGFNACLKQYKYQRCQGSCTFQNEIVLDFKSISSFLGDAKVILLSIEV